MACFIKLTQLVDNNDSREILVNMDQVECVVKRSYDQELGSLLFGPNNDMIMWHVKESLADIQYLIDNTKMVPQRVYIDNMPNG